MKRDWREETWCWEKGRVFQAWKSGLETDREEEEEKEEEAEKAVLRSKD